MIKEFESATDEGDKDFYLGACRSIQAAYDLDMILAGSDDNKIMRAKLLLNLRKNSLLLKVPARWDYATMTLGVSVKPLKPVEPIEQVLEPPFSVPLQNESGYFCFENVAFQLLYSIDSVRKMAEKTEDQIKEITKKCSSIADNTYKQHCPDVFLNAYHVLHLMEEQYKEDKNTAPNAQENKSKLQEIKNKLLTDKSGQADAAEFLTRVLLLYLKIDKDIYDSIKFERYNLKLCNSEVNNENMKSFNSGKYSTDNGINNPDILKRIGIDIDNKNLIDITSIPNDDFYLMCSVIENFNLQNCIDDTLDEKKYDKATEPANIEIETQLSNASSCIIDNMVNKNVIYIPNEQKYLVIILNRFKDDGTMNNEKIKVDETITINQDTNYDNMLQKLKVNFKLRGVICKTGSENGGHYVYISIENDKKILYNDSAEPVKLTNQYNMDTQGYVFLYEKVTSQASEGSEGGGYKSAHNTTTNHTASKSKHNSSFKASSSKTKGKSHNRSHTQRVK